MYLAELQDLRHSKIPLVNLDLELPSNLDSRNNLRGHCSLCGPTECSVFQWFGIQTNLKCAFCDHAPTNHVKLNADFPAYDSMASIMDSDCTTLTNTPTKLPAIMSQETPAKFYPSQYQHNFKPNASSTFARPLTVATTPFQSFSNSSVYSPVIHSFDSGVSISKNQPSPAIVG